MMILAYIVEHTSLELVLNAQLLLDKTTLTTKDQMLLIDFRQWTGCDDPLNF